MKKIEAIVFLHELGIILLDFLEAGILNTMVSEVHNYSTNTPHTELYRSEVFLMDSNSRFKVETIIPQNLVSRAIEIISGTRQMEEGERGTILISTVNDIHR